MVEKKVYYVVEDLGVFYLQETAPMHTAVVYPKIELTFEEYQDFCKAADDWNSWQSRLGAAGPAD